MCNWDIIHLQQVHLLLAQHQLSSPFWDPLPSFLSFPVLCHQSFFLTPQLHIFWRGIKLFLINQNLNIRFNKLKFIWWLYEHKEECSAKNAETFYKRGKIMHIWERKNEFFERKWNKDSYHGRWTIIISHFHSYNLLSKVYSILYQK